MTYQSEREQFLLTMQSEGMSSDIARRILRHANTVQRLSAAECNGDYPCDNGERKVEFCSRCEAGYVRASMLPDRAAPLVGGISPRNGHYSMICPNCHAQDLIAQWCEKAVSTSSAIAGYRFTPIFSGDPRGARVKLRVPSGTTDDGGREGICVPTRRY